SSTCPRPCWKRFAERASSPELASRVHPELFAQTPYPCERRRQLILGDPELQTTLHQLVELSGGDDRLVAAAGLGEAAHRQRAHRPDALERADDRRARLGLTLGSDRREAQGVDERSERLVIVARVEPAAPYLGVAPPEPLVDLVAPCGRHR